MAEYGDFDKWPEHVWRDGEWWCGSGSHRWTGPLHILQERFKFQGIPSTFTVDNGRLWRWKLEAGVLDEWVATPLGLEEECAECDRLVAIGVLVDGADPVEYFA